MKTSIQIFFLAAIIAGVAACSTTPKGEADQYNKMRKGTVYKTYQKLSIEAMKPVVREYDKKLAEDNKSQVGNAHLHTLLGLIWVVSAQPKFALAETEYAIEQSGDPRDRYAALTIQALAMHEQGWPYMAKLASTQANVLVKTHGFSNSYRNVLTLVHVAGSALALKEGNLSYAISEVRELGLATNQNWLVELGDASQELHTGTEAKAVAKLEKLKNDPELSEQQRKGVGKVLDVASVGGKDVASSVTKAVVSMAVEDSIRDHPLTTQILDKLPEKYRSKLAGDL